MMMNGIGTNTRLDTVRAATTSRAAATTTAGGATASAATAETQPTTQVAREVGAGAPSLAADLVSAMGPPLDLAKIARIRAAIAEGRYEIEPQKIADRMVDADLPARS